MKKKGMLIFIAMLAVVLVLSGCSSTPSSEETTTSTEGEPAQKGETFYAKLCYFHAGRRSF
jgi:ABC-type glycerol-3-phosphate transport system substrate-binding protein